MCVCVVVARPLSLASVGTVLYECARVLVCARSDVIMHGTVLNFLLLSMVLNPDVGDIRDFLIATCLGCGQFDNIILGYITIAYCSIYILNNFKCNN